MVVEKSNFLEKHHKGHYEDYWKEILHYLKWLWRSVSWWPPTLTLTTRSSPHSPFWHHQLMKWPRTFYHPSIHTSWRFFCAILCCKWTTLSKVPCPEVLCHGLWKFHRPPDVQPLKTVFLSWPMTWLQSECNEMSAIALVWDVVNRGRSVIVVGSWVDEWSEYQLPHFTPELST